MTLVKFYHSNDHEVLPLWVSLWMMVIRLVSILCCYFELLFVLYRSQVASSPMSMMAQSPVAPASTPRNQSMYGVPSPSSNLNTPGIELSPQFLILRYQNTINFVHFNRPTLTYKKTHLFKFNKTSPMQKHV